MEMQKLAFFRDAPAPWQAPHLEDPSKIKWISGKLSIKKPPTDVSGSLLTTKIILYRGV